MDGSIEIRPDDTGGIDEIVGYGVLVHIERMDKGAWFIILTRPDQTQEAFWLTGKGKVEFTLHEHRPAPTTGPNAAPWVHEPTRAQALKEAAEVLKIEAGALASETAHWNHFAETSMLAGEEASLVEGLRLINERAKNLRAAIEALAKP